MKRLRSKAVKNILGILIIVWCSGIFLNGYVGMGEAVHAEPAQTNEKTAADNTNSQIDTMSIWQILNMVLKIIYLLLWPLLVIAGLALDNTLVYASIFHLDAPLWQFRNMMKNFANFTLWFMVLFAIIKSIISNSWAWSAKDEKSPLGIIKTTLIAGILIQASWFLVAALVDVSTIATYAVGGLPLSVLKNTTIGNQKILSVNSSIDLNKFDISSAWGEDFQVWYSTQHPTKAGGDHIVTMSPCRVERSYVIWREYGDPKYKNTAKFKDEFKDLEVCVLFGNQLVMWPEDAFMQKIKDIMSVNVTWPMPDYNNKVWYNYYINGLLNMTWWDTMPELTGKMVYLGSWTTAFATGNLFFAGTNSLTIATLIQKSKWFVGPLVTMYSSLLNFAQLTNTSVTTTSWTSGIFIIKALVAIALFFPLIALALVLILRIGILWLYIVASPFIILKESFKNFVKIDGLDKYLSIKSVIGIIFAPVVTVAALSLSLIFMTALVNGFTSTDISSAIHESLGITKLNDAKPGNDAVSFGWGSSMEFSKLPWWEAMDWFSWLMVNFFAIGLMRMIFFAALKSNELGKSVGGKVQSFGENVFKTLPILPMGWWVGLGSAANVLKSVPDRWVNDREREQVRIANDYVFGKEDSWTGSGSSFTGDNAKTIVTGLWSLSTPTDKAAATQIFTGNKITNPTENINTNSQLYYDAIKAMDKDPTKQKNAIEAMATITGNPNWYANMVKTETINTTKNDLDTITTKAQDWAALQAIFERPTTDEKTKIEAHFTATGWTPYEVTALDKIVYIITQKTTTPPITYTVEKKKTT